MEKGAINLKPVRVFTKLSTTGSTSLTKFSHLINSNTKKGIVSDLSDTGTIKKAIHSFEIGNFI